MSKLVKIENCAHCPNRVMMGDKHHCELEIDSYIFLGVTKQLKRVIQDITHIPGWCRLKDAPLEPTQ